MGKKPSKSSVKVVVERLPDGKSSLRLVGTNIPENLKPCSLKILGMRIGLRW